MYQAFGDRAEFVFVYILEAHPEGEDHKAPPRARFDASTDLEVGGNGALPQARTDAERREGALLCTESLGLTMRTVTDDMQNSTNSAYGAWPDRMYIVGVDGRVAFQGEPGPMGYDPDAVQAALEAIVGPANPAAQ